MNISSNSPKFSLNGIDFKKIFTGLLIGLGGAVIVFLTDIVMTVHPTVCAESLPLIGQYCFDVNVLLVPIGAALVNLIRKWISSHKTT